MFIAHLPAGYLLGTTLRQLSNKTLFVGCILGSIIPDLDMFYFYFIDNRQTHHHEYLTHWPLTWFGVVLFGLLNQPIHRTFSFSLLGLGIGGLLHMVLDSVAAPINWLAPFSDLTVELITIPAAHSNWVLSFLLHWTFLIEIGICLVAGFYWWKSKSSRPI